MPRPRTDLGILHARIADAIGCRTNGEEDRVTMIPGLSLFRRETVSEPSACLVEPSVVFVVRGAKQMLIGENAYTYDRERFLVASLDLPASSQVLAASPNDPCLGLILRLDLRLLSELMAHVRLPSSRNASLQGSAALGAVTTDLLEPFDRLLALLDRPDDIVVLAPLITREIHYRLFQSDVAQRLLQIVSVGSQNHRIARAIDWLKVNYARPLRIEELAGHVQLSASTLHHHFRQLTTMSPLQYQKWMRLNEARRMMLNEHVDAASASFKVGYESPSQFSREYSRLFGVPPKRDIGDLRAKARKGVANMENTI